MAVLPNGECLTSVRDGAAKVNKSTLGAIQMEPHFRTMLEGIVLVFHFSYLLLVGTTCVLYHVTPPVSTTQLKYCFFDFVPFHR